MNRRPVVRIVVVVAATLAVAAIASVVAFFLLYVDTQDIDSASAAREFEAARARFAGQAPLLEFRDSQLTPVHPNSGARHPLVAVHALVYDATEGYLRRVDVPIGLLRVATLGSRINLASLGITVDDLERHGPGLVLDMTGGSVAMLPAADAIVGTHSIDSQMLIWTE